MYIHVEYNNIFLTIYIFALQAYYIIIMMVVSEAIAEVGYLQLQLMKTSDTLYSNVFSTLDTLSDIACAHACVNTRLCLSANYHPGTRTCALINDTGTFVADVNWHAYSVISGTGVLSYK